MLYKRNAFVHIWSLFKHELTIKVFANDFDIHKDYKDTDSGNDICLIELPANFSGGRAPCMMQPEANKTAEKQIEGYHGAQCWVAGWGHTFYAGHGFKKSIKLISWFLFMFIQFQNRV